ncbi:hypothetical protein E4U56_004468 [Claviceps arundinis]|uniref:Uncharacterized protein n=1 Tax=Claviceps arundinis TaxID=1623583 RepID=A0A9P7MML2_9HYPO|nr:hypothetical protein E4U56_004468 [Claviceps arundinis]
MVMRNYPDRVVTKKLLEDGRCAMLESDELQSDMAVKDDWHSPVAFVLVFDFVEPKRGGKLSLAVHEFGVGS